DRHLPVRLRRPALHSRRARDGGAEPPAVQPAPPRTYRSLGTGQHIRSRAHVLVGTAAARMAGDPIDDRSLATSEIGNLYRDPAERRLFSAGSARPVARRSAEASRYVLPCRSASL